MGICKAITFPFPDNVTGGIGRPLKYLDIVDNPKCILLGYLKNRKA